MSDERKKAKSKKVSDERHVEVARQLGMDPDEIAVLTNPDGEYAVGRDGHRLLLLDRGEVAWYGDKAPNPTYQLVRPTVLVDESDVEEIEGPLDLPVEPGETPLPTDDAGANVALTQPVEGEQEAAAKKPGPPPRPAAKK